MQREVVSWIMGPLALALSAIGPASGEPPARLTLKSCKSLAQMSPRMHASYLKPAGVEMIKPSGSGVAYSPDNGRTWSDRPANPDFDGRLPHGYRREPFPIFVDPVSGRAVKIMNSLDTPGLDPSIVEPPIALNAYYLRYRVSIDGGKTFLFDEPIVEQGRTPENPFRGVWKGKNGIFMGDVGSQLIRTKGGRIVVPSQACKLGPDGKLFSPGGGFTYTDVIMLLGTWSAENRLTWQISQPIEADPARSTRGMIEPTVAELPEGRILCIMRGSNGGSKDPEFRIPSRRWWSVSYDGGFHWTRPEPWTYDDGNGFYSPSSMSQLLKHSSGRIFWIGNLSPANCQGNNPRHPLVIGEVDRKTLRLVKTTILQIDAKRPGEPGVNLSHWWGFEDRESRDIVIVGARYSLDYTKSPPVEYVIGVESN